MKNHNARGSGKSAKSFAQRPDAILTEIGEDPNYEIGAIDLCGLFLRLLRDGVDFHCSILYRFSSLLFWGQQSDYAWNNLYREGHHSQHRDAYPSGPAVQFIEYFIESLIQQKYIKQLPKVSAARGEKVRAMCGVPVSAQEFRCHELLPELAPGFKTSEILGTPRGIIN